MERDQFLLLIIGKERLKIKRQSKKTEPMKRQNNAKRKKISRRCKKYSKRPIDKEKNP